MTLTPTDTRQVRGCKGPEIPVAYLCAVPPCLDRAQQRHHLYRRSLLAGAYDWVEVLDGEAAGLRLRNVVDLCRFHHHQITDNKAWIRLIDREFIWCFVDESKNWVAGGPLTYDEDESVFCRECGQPKRRLQHTHQPLPKRRSKTMTITVPDDKEDGADVLQTLVDAICNDLGYQGPKGLSRYHALTAAAVFTLLHRGAFLKERE